MSTPEQRSFAEAVSAFCTSFSAALQSHFGFLLFALHTGRCSADWSRTIGIAPIGNRQSAVVLRQISTYGQSCAVMSGHERLRALSRSPPNLRSRGAMQKPRPIPNGALRTRATLSTTRSALQAGRPSESAPGLLAIWKGCSMLSMDIIPVFGGLTPPWREGRWKASKITYLWAFWSE